MKIKWNEFSSDAFEYHFTEDQLKQQYLSENNFMKIIGYFTIGIYLVFTCISAFFNLSLIDPINHWVSDFGNSILNPYGATIYNIGCILTGSFLMIFFIGLKNLLNIMEKGKNFLLIIIIFGIFLSFSDIMIGVFSEDMFDAHLFWSLTFFITLIPILLLGGIVLTKYVNFPRIIGYYGIILTLINISFLFFYKAYKYVKTKN